MRKVIHCVPSMGQNGGGPPRSVSQLCNELVDQDLSVGVVTAQYANDPIVYLDPRVETTLLVGNGTRLQDRLRPTGFTSALAAAYNSGQMELVHQHGLWLRSAHDTVDFARRKNIPIVLAARGMLEPWAINNQKWLKKVAWTLYQKRDLEAVTAFHATAESEAMHIRRLGFKQPIAVIPNGVQLGPQSFGDKDDTVRENGKKTALFLSRINPKKGIPMLLDAWKSLGPENWQLVIAGNDDSNHLPELHKQISKLGLQDSVDIVGSLFGSEKEAAYRAADLFVLPSYSENFGIVVAEALGFGLPVVTTTGCPWEELNALECGWCVEPTLEGIRSALKLAFAASPEKLRQMGSRGRALVEKKYQWPAIGRKTIGLYNWILEGGDRPDFVLE